MRLISVFLIAVTLSSCARIAVLKEITPVFRPDAAVKVDIDSHARAFREASHFEKTDPYRAGEYYIAALAELTAKLQKQPDSAGLQLAYNYALDRMFSLIRMHNLNPWGTPLRFGKYSSPATRCPSKAGAPQTSSSCPRIRSK